MTDKTPKTPPAPAAPSKAKGQTRARDTRPPHVIFAERFNGEARLMTRRFKNLAALGGAKRARPTPEQYQAVQTWLREQTELCLADMGRKLRQQEAQPTEEQPFAVLPEAPAKVTSKPTNKA